MRFPGIIPAVTTPFDANGAVDTAGIAANVRFLLDAGVHGIVGTGTMGAGMAQVRVKLARVVVTGVVPVTLHSEAPVAEFSDTWMRG